MKSNQSTKICGVMKPSSITQTKIVDDKKGKGSLDLREVFQVSVTRRSVVSHYGTTVKQSWS
jgi:hypothetical protein